MLGTIEDDNYYDQQPSSDDISVQNFFNLGNPILQEKRSDKNSSMEQKYEDQQPDLPNGPKLAEVPEYEDIPKELLSSLDFNPKLTESQRSQLGRIILQSAKAFSLDGQIGEYLDIKYTIKLKEDTVPISMPPYSDSKNWFTSGNFFLGRSIAARGTRAKSWEI